MEQGKKPAKKTAELSSVVAIERNFCMHVVVRDVVVIVIHIHTTIG